MLSCLCNIHVYNMQGSHLRCVQYITKGSHDISCTCMCMYSMKITIFIMIFVSNTYITFSALQNTSQIFLQNWPPITDMIFCTNCLCSKL